MDKQLLILDLDETLVYASEQPLDREPHFHLGGYFVYRRPFLSEFLAAVLEWFQVAVWSSAGSHYIHGIVQQIFPDPGRLRFVWSRERCTRRFDPERWDHYWVKNLRKVKRIGFPLERMLMIDDSAEALQMHYGNHLRLRPFFGEKDDEQLRRVLPFLHAFWQVENLRTVEKRCWR